MMGFGKSKIRKELNHTKEKNIEQKQEIDDYKKENIRLIEQCSKHSEDIQNLNAKLLCCENDIKRKIDDNNIPHNYEFIKLEDLLKINIHFTEWQRPINEKRCNVITEFIEKELEIKNFFTTPLIFGIIKSERKYHIIDGQHRYEALKMISNKTPNLIIPIIKIFVDNEEKLKYIFRSVNQSLPLPDVYKEPDGQDEVTVCKNVYEYFENRFTTFISYKPAKRPRINETDFQNKIYELIGELKLSDTEEMIELISEENNIYSNKNRNYFQQISDRNYNRCVSGKFYLGLDKKYDWVDAIIKKHKPEREPEPNPIYCISKETRIKLWKKYDIKLCYCCEKEVISEKNFEAGHIIARNNNGNNNLINLRPICGFCNKSMGTLHMFDYMIAKYPNTIDKSIKMLKDYVDERNAYHI